MAVKVEMRKCAGCGCVRSFCPWEVIEFEKDKAKMTRMIVLNVAFDFMNVRQRLCLWANELFSV